MFASKYCNGADAPRICLNLFMRRSLSGITQSQTNVEVTKEEDWNTLLRMEEEYIENICAQIVAFHPDIVITEKGVSDLAQHYLMKADITVSFLCRRRVNL